MADAPREAWITGIGIVSSLGEGAEAHWQALLAGTHQRRHRDGSRPTSSIRWRRSISTRRSPRRATSGRWSRGSGSAPMRPASRSTTPGSRATPDILARTDMIVAAGGGERDMAVDGTILTGIAKAADPEAFLNERLMSDLRPTLFLAQLSNLLAGNISIVHGVIGSSRTFMGEESAGVDAVRIALARIRPATATSPGRRLAALRARGHAAALRVRRANLREHVRAGLAARAAGRLRARLARRLPGARSAQPRRGARRQAAGPAHGRAVRARQARARRAPGDARADVGHDRPEVAHAASAAVISGATGVEPATGEERAFLAAHPDVPVRAIRYPDRPWRRAAVSDERGARRAGATAMVRCFRRATIPASNGAWTAQLTQVVVTSVGIVRGEGMALLEAVH